MTYTLKSNATTATAKIAFVGENGLVNLVDASAIAVVGTVASSTVNGHTVYGDAVTTATNHLQATISSTIASSQKFSVLLVGRAPIDLNNDTIIVSAPIGNLGTTFSPARMKSTYTGYGAATGGTLTGYTHPESASRSLVWGREALSPNQGWVHYTNAVRALAAQDTFVKDSTAAAGDWKFGGRPSGTAGGFAAGIFALFVGTSPDELETYVAANAGSATGVERYYAALFDQPSSLSGGVTLDPAVAAGTLGSSASDLGGNVTLDAAVAAGTLGVQPGTLTTAPWRSPVTGALLASVTIPKISILRISDMTQVLTLTNQTTNGSGVLTITNAALLPAVPYLVIACNADGTAVGAEAYTAT